MQTTSHILMIRPVHFAFNPETAVNNAFQVAGRDDDAQNRARVEFDAFVDQLRRYDIDVMVVDDTLDPHTPDSIFPNNWISFHQDGTVFLYPMFARNRRLERKPQVLDSLRHSFRVEKVIDLSGYEAQDLFLEGTGSMVLDRDHRIAYACISPRTHEKVLEDFCRQSGYTPVIFHAVDGHGMPIYHTNVMMCVADRFVVICLASIPDPGQKEMVRQKIEASGKQILEISFEQLNQFAGNMLQVSNKKGEKVLVMSSRAFASLSPAQISTLNKFNPIVHAPLTMIEDNGGGSARCMMAEVYLPLLNQ